MAFYNDKNDITNFVISFSSTPKQDFGTFAQGYRNAAKSIAEKLLNKPGFSDYEAYPVVFLYRHAFELFLKSYFYRIILIRYFSNMATLWERFMTEHRLTPIAEFLVKEINRLFYDQPETIEKAKEIYEIAIEFDQIDSNSYGYRYPTDKHGNYPTDPHQIVNLGSFYKHMEKVMDKLQIFNFGLNADSDERQINFELYEEIKRHFGLSDYSNN